MNWECFLGAFIGGMIAASIGYWWGYRDRRTKAKRRP